MKKFFSILVVFSLAFFMGCQENLINEPETSALNKEAESGLEDVIKICCPIQDPVYGMCSLNGCVIYTHQILAISMNPMGNSIYEIGLHLEMDSELCDLLGIVHLPWKAKGCYDDVIYISEEGIILLEKEYAIANRNDVLLCVNYLVTTEGVGIAEIWIDEIE